MSQNTLNGICMLLFALVISFIANTMLGKTLDSKVNENESRITQELKECAKKNTLPKDQIQLIKEELAKDKPNFTVLSAYSKICKYQGG